MPVTNYYSVNGVLIGESTGGVRTDYLTDALGAVTATMDQSANIKNTYRYKPYGDVLAKTGTDPDPKFMWNGSTGSRKTGLANSGQYNINRHYGTEQAAWTSRDPLWPRELAYVYGGGNPTTLKDFLGLAACCRCGVDTCNGSPNGGGSTGATTYIINKHCEKAYLKYIQCEGLSHEAFCQTTGSDNNCCDAAKRLGVPADCLCAVLATERSWYNRLSAISWCSDRMGIGQTVGCAQMSVDVAKQSLKKLCKCLPTLCKKEFPGYPYSDRQVRNLLINDCDWATKVAAAYLRVNLDAKCTNSGKPGTCKNWAYLWNPKGKFQTMVKCALEAFKGDKLCS